MSKKRALLTQVGWTVLIGGVLTWLFLAVFNLPDSNAPGFEIIHSFPSADSLQQIGYDFSNSKPFESGVMWIQASQGTNRQTFVFTIDERRIMGRLTNGWPVTMIGKKHLLCTRTIPDSKTLEDRLKKFLSTVSFGRMTFPPRTSKPQRYWLLNLERNTASRIGDLRELPNFILQTSSDFHYGYAPMLGKGLQLDVFCFDFKKKSISKLDIAGWPLGWWDEQNILVQTTNKDLVLHRVPTGKIAPLISSKQVATFLQDNMITEDPKKAQTFFMWNGRENDFYITDTYKRWLATESYLIKVERPDAKLKLLAKEFKFEWSDRFDSTGRYYLYTGRELGSNSDGVFLRDTKVGTNRTVVVPMDAKYMSIPRFYRDSIIYIRSNNLWRINLDGTHNIRLFPP